MAMVSFPQRALPTKLRATVEDIIKCHGPVADLGGEPGINQETSDAFFLKSRRMLHWEARRTGIRMSVSSGTRPRRGRRVSRRKGKGKRLLHALRHGRLRHSRSDTASRSAEDYQGVARKRYQRKASTSRISRWRRWRQVTPAFDCRNQPSLAKTDPALRQHAIVPLLGKKESLSAAEWATLSARFEAFEAWQSAEARRERGATGRARLREIAASNHREAIDELIRLDKSVETEVKATLWWNGCCATAATCTSW